MVSNYVPKDGYTRKGYVAEQKGIHGEFRFEYRPMMTLELDMMNQGLNRRKDVIEQERFTANVVLGKITDWSFEDLDGKIVPIEVNNVLDYMIPQLWSKIVGIVCGSQPSDEDPMKDVKEDQEKIFNESGSLKN